MAVYLSTKVMRILLVVPLLLSVTLILASCSKNEQPPIVIEQAWIREAPPNASAMAGYMRISNHSDLQNSLIAASSAAFKVIEFHRSVEKEGVYRMVRHKQLAIPAKGTLELKPGDYHLMMITPQRSLKDGDHVSVHLTFTNQFELTLEIPVKKAAYN